MHTVTGDKAGTILHTDLQMFSSNQGQIPCTRKSTTTSSTPSFGENPSALMTRNRIRGNSTSGSIPNICSQREWPNMYRIHQDDTGRLIITELPCRRSPIMFAFTSLGQTRRLRLRGSSWAAGSGLLNWASLRCLQYLPREPRMQLPMRRWLKIPRWLMILKD